MLATILFKISHYQPEIYILYTIKNMHKNSRLTTTQYVDYVTNTLTRYKIRENYFCDKWSWGGECSTPKVPEKSPQKFVRNHEHDKYLHE